MKSHHPLVRLSDIDEERFGIRTARTDEVSAEALPSVLSFCHRHAVVLLIARCPASDLRAAQAMEREGFLLMDTLLHYGRDLLSAPLPAKDPVIPVRAALPGEEGDVAEVAAQAFRSYLGHYHADERLDRGQCDEVYTSWALRSCLSRDVAEEVLVASPSDSIVGFLTLRMAKPEEGQGILFAVSPSAQGRGAASALMIGGIRWCLEKGASRMLIPTQVNNMPSQKVWCRLGFEPSHAQYTFHKWFD
jgi:GNAT superfamily N-acetyltransferase